MMVEISGEALERLRALAQQMEVDEPAVLLRALTLLEVAVEKQSAGNRVGFWPKGLGVPPAFTEIVGIR